MEVHVGEKSHDKLAIHPVRNASMPRDAVTEILNVERALEARGKKPTKRRNQRSKGTENKNMTLHRRHGYCFEVGKPDRELIKVRDEDRIWRTFQTREDVRTKVLRRLEMLNEISTAR